MQIYSNTIYIAELQSIFSSRGGVFFQATHPGGSSSIYYTRPRGARIFHPELRSCDTRSRVCVFSSQCLYNVVFATVSLLYYISHGHHSGFPRLCMTMATEGYNCKIIGSVPDYLQTNCLKCKRVLRNPWQVTCCGKEYCKYCIEQHKGPCLNRECRVKTFNKFPDKNHQRILNQFKVSCPNERCEWKEKLSQLDEHLNLNPSQRKQLEGCMFSSVQCMHCDNTFIRREIADHQQKQCDRRPFICKYCHYRSTFKDINTKHLQVCPKHPVDCPQRCGLIKTLERQDVQNHIKYECDMTIVECDFPECKEKFQRKLTQSHKDRCVDKHMQLLLSRVKQLEEEKTQREERERKEEEDRLRLKVLPITLTMSDFVQLKNTRRSWQSQVFYTREGGYALHLSVHPAGKGFTAKAAFGEAVTVYLYRARGDYDEELRWPLKGTVTITLLDQQNGENHLTETADIQFSRHGNNDSKAWHTFIYHKNIARFVKNNSLKFIISMIEHV